MNKYPKIGEIWRNDGKANWAKVTGVCLPGHPDHDGGAPGVSIVRSTMKGNWQRRGWFVLCNSYEQFKERMEADCLRKAKP